MPSAEFPAVVQQDQDGQPVRVTLIAPEEICRLPGCEARERLDALLSQVRTKPEMILYHLGAFASYVEPQGRAGLAGFNTEVKFSIPYTLHLPGGRLFRIHNPIDGTEGALMIRKTWTELATESSDVEAFADDQLLYYGPSPISSVTIPQPLTSGPWPRLGGKNVEILKDTCGIFRYTRVWVWFNTNYTDLSTADQTTCAAAVRHGSETGLQALNYLLDVYRYVTGEIHIEQLSRATLNSVYFSDHNLVYEGAGIETGVASAVVNRSASEIERIADILAAGVQPERHTMLLHSADAALERGQLVLALIAAFQALDIYLEQRLRDAYAKLGWTEANTTARLKEVYKTKDRLATLCREVTGISIASDTTFWATWLAECNRRRNDVVHRNQPLNQAEAERVVVLCKDCISRIAGLPFPS